MLLTHQQPRVNCVLLHLSARRTSDFCFFPLNHHSSEREAKMAQKAKKPLSLSSTAGQLQNSLARAQQDWNQWTLPA